MIINLNSQGLLDIGDFFKTLQECIYANYGKDKILFTSAYPNITDIQNIKPPIITYYFKQEVSDFSGTKEIKARHGETREFISEKGKKISIELKRQRYEYRITFEVWETSGERADEATRDFKKLLMSLTGYFQGLGVQNLMFKAMNGEQPDKKWKTDLTRRELVYILYLDEITSVTSPTISAFDINGFVYKTYYHLIEREGTAIDGSYLEGPVGDVPIAASTPRVASVKSKDGDEIIINLKP